MRILFFSDYYPPEVNAAATRVHERARLWVREGHDVTVITSVPNFPQGRVHAGYRNRLWQSEIIDGVKVVRVWTFVAANEGTVRRFLDFLSYMVTSFIFAWREKRPDIVTSTSPQFFCAVAAWAHASMRRLPYVFELSDLWPASITALGAMKPGLLMRWMEQLELHLYRSADSVVALTEDFRRDLTSRGIAPGKIYVVRNGVDLSQYSPRPRDAARAAELGLTDTFTLAYIGTHGVAHALDNLLRAAKLVAATAPQVRFLLVGDGAARDDLLKLQKELRLSNVLIAGPQPKADMPSWWSIADVAIVSLRNIELFSGVIPSKIFEAMGMGLPILFVAPEGEASRIVTDAGCGIAVPPEDPRALADAVTALAADPARVARFRKASIAAAPKHSRTEQAQKMLEVYRAVLEARAASRL